VANSNRGELEEIWRPLNQGNDDMTKTKEEAQAKAEEEARVKAEEQARTKTAEEPRARAAKEARINSEKAARTKAAKEARVRAAEDARAKAEEEARARAAEEARAKAAEEARAKAAEEAGAKAAEEARAKAAEEARVRAEEDARAKAEEEARVRAEEEARVAAAQANAGRVRAEKEIANFQALRPSSPLAAAVLATCFQTIAVEATDYSKKSIESGSAFVEKLLGAKSLESAIRIQSEYANTSYAGFVAYVTKISGLYSKLAKEGLKRRYHIS